MNDVSIKSALFLLICVLTALLSSSVTAERVKIDIAVPFEKHYLVGNSYFYQGDFYSAANIYSLNSLFNPNSNEFTNWVSTREFPYERLNPNMALVGFSLVNSGTDEKQIFLRTTYSPAHDIRTVVIRKNSKKNTQPGSLGFGVVDEYSLHDSHQEWEIEKDVQYGVYHTFSSRPFFYRDYVVPITVGAGEEKRIAINFSYAQGVVLHKTFISNESIARLYGAGRPLIEGMVVGIVMLLSILAILVRLRFKDNSFLFYSLKSFSAAIYFLCVDGYGYVWLWGDVSWFSSIVFDFSWLAFCLGFYLFSNAFMNFDKRLKLLWLVNVFSSYVTAVVIFLVLFANHFLSSYLTASTVYFFFLVFTINMCAAAWLWIKGMTVYRDYFMAWVLFFVASGFNVLGGVYNVAGIDFLYITKTCYVLTSIFLFLSLLSRINTIGVERERALSESRAKSEFVAKVGHEIRIPMNSIIAQSELVSDTHLDKVQSEYVKIIHRSGVTLLNIITEIMDYAKMTTGETQLTMNEFNLKEMCQSSVDRFSNDADKKNISLILKADNSVHCNWSGDNDKVERLINILVNNAIKFTEVGEVILEILPGESDKGVILNISDTGIGLSEEQIERLFDEFSQVDTSTSRKYGGTGLGLAICKQLVELMGGQIDVQSQPGVGTAFIIFLPLKAVST